MSSLSSGDNIPVGSKSFEAVIQYGKEDPYLDTYIYDTIDRERTNISFDPVHLTINDARGAADRLRLAENGFELGRHDSLFATLANEQGGVGEDVSKLRADYFAEMIPYMREVSGTPHIIAQDSGFLIRHGRKSAIRTLARPASFAHCDYTTPTAEAMSRLVCEESGERVPPYRHFAIYQTWRAVSPPPQDSLLALCDGRTVAEDDYVLLRTITGPEDVPGNVFITKMGLARPHHRWFYFSELTERDVLLFLAHDSRRETQLNVLHTSVSNVLPDDVMTPRVSIEARFFAFFE